MKRKFPFYAVLPFLITSSAIATRAQNVSPDKLVRPRTVAAANQQTSQTPSVQTQKPAAAAPAVPPAAKGNELPVGSNPIAPIPTGVVTAKKVTPPVMLPLAPSMVMTRISEAQRLLKTKPQTTALTTPSISFVTIAAFEPGATRTHLITLSKETFLTKGSEVTVPSSLGVPVTIRVIRANGVNTALSLVTPDGTSLVPLTVEYPIERNGLFREMAYYTSAHPALLSNDLTRSGQAYVRNMLDLAVKRLSDKGVAISPQLVDIAERLCVVEHTDHDRFRNENRLALYNEIYSLYALNEIETYKYSVSVAGAGGMVQMIPWAYNLIRQRHPGVGLIPDFVTGMRNHGNALQAMLLYMQDTWNDLSANEDVKYALNAKIATIPELMAAGYNSNAAKLPSYIRRGGQDWRTLIPRETQMYLQIYKSFESLIPLKARTVAEVTEGDKTN
ncbi:MAG TPA: hypothetical protein VLB68_02970 [Pyrinomonadaceae bacterium]|nr:hypothetical protein [Pyrinomonadaceae bacterium]